MSFSYNLLSISFALLLVFASCEDNKKSSEAKTKAANVAVTDTISEKNNSEIKDDKKLPDFPKITEENAVEFFTKYGKENPETKVLITTQYGGIELELYQDTPLHRANFIYLTKRKYFDGTFFHRVVPNFIIQGGNSDLRSTPEKRADIGKDYLIPAELKNGRKHSYGSISGAKEYRENPDKNSIPFEFFIFLGPQTSTSHLNGNYTVFGKVVKGMDIVEKIADLKTGKLDDWPLQNVYIQVEILE
ncbi:peptidylprolyl isomerase [Ulvibacter antarcticus]|uniref:Peptidyl-prolyl cis-trans isomerase n=1 Tax=Ulvibacter antarcticus TaxID=442714 RepID=A0A3L9ZDJ2_9FLAO|nr:peptidylprolyl isomerase [Ulvibacter antarcticus]RMA64732.1 peptidylprolyl isomerase [Ulvibacter antarcticus]